MSKKALFIIDAQNDFITGTLANKRAAKKVSNIVQKINDCDGLIFATHDTHFNKLQVESAWPPEDGPAYEDSLEYTTCQTEHCIKLSDGWDIEPTILAALQNKNKDLHKSFFSVDKYTYGKHDWETYLKFFEFDEIELCGFNSASSVLANAVQLRSIYPNKKIIIDVNCIDDINDELQNAAITCLKAQNITIIGE